MSQALQGKISQQLLYNHPNTMILRLAKEVREVGDIRTKIHTFTKEKLKSNL